MSPIPLGILASSGGGAAGSYELISTTILSSSQATVTLGSIPQTYKHLQIRIEGGSGGMNGYPDYWRMYVNGSQSGGNYASHYLRGNGSSVVSGATSGQASMLTLLAMGDHPDANRRGAAIIDLLDYTSTVKTKTVRALSGTPVQGTGPAVHFASGFANEYGAITSVSFVAAGGPSIWTGSRFSLYGIKG